MFLTRIGVSAGLALALAAPPSHGQATTAAAPIDTTVNAGESEAEEPRRKLVKWNEYEGPISTFRFGFGFLVNFAGYVQDDASKQQFDLENDVGVRDFRLLFKGRFKTERPFSWTLGYMYDGADDDWHFRQTGFMIGFPELYGRVFIGRTKEGYALVKDMVGYHGWTMERSPAEDAFFPILGDGVKWMGYLPKPRIFYHVGAFADWLSEHEKFATSDHQIITRVGWLPILSDDGEDVWHVGVMNRSAQPDEGSLQVRARPGSYLAPYFLDTGRFPASRTRLNGAETFYRTGPWLFGGEYHWQSVAVDGQDPLFHGGDATVAWLMTGETRPYNPEGAYFGAVSPERTVFEGGPGAWEAVLNFTYTDFDSAAFTGGKYWRLTPMVNWHLSDNVRLEFAYGYGVLDRFGLNGRTQFFQFRLQTTL